MKKIPDERLALLKSQYSDKNQVSFSVALTHQSQKYWWQCSQGHEFQQTISVRKRPNSSSCVVCSGRKPLGQDSLLSAYPMLVERFWDASNSVAPDAVTYGSKQKVRWKCEQQHVWVQEIRQFVKSPRCKQCEQIAHQKLSSLALDYWNETLSPQQLILSRYHRTRNRISWICEQGHEWKQSLESFEKTRQCFQCHSLGAQHPRLIQEWDTERNLLTPFDYSVASAYLASWVCSQNHSWQATIYSRTRKRSSGCPHCQGSQGELELFEYLQSISPYPLKKNVRNIISPFELDIYIPDLKLAIEFNGLYWHSSRFKHRTYHQDKWLACYEQGIRLIQVWEDDWFHCPHETKTVLSNALKVSGSHELSLTAPSIEIALDVGDWRLLENHGYVLEQVKEPSPWFIVNQRRCDTIFEYNSSTLRLWDAGHAVYKKIL